jgi:putative SOS response-associated peptidase YedK
MCGRFTVQVGTPDLADLFGAVPVGESLKPSFNVAPGQFVPVVIQEGDGLCLASFKWGLVPSWAKDPAIGNKLINARAETVAEKPSFRQAFMKRRCLILADGFFEWKSEGGRKVPYHITLTDRSVFAFAGLWERWKSPEGIEIRSCVIITLAANDFMRPIHHRMPAILSAGAERAWLDPGQTDVQGLLAMLAPYPSAAMKAVAVSAAVNSPRNNSPQCLLPMDGQENNES